MLHLHAHFWQQMLTSWVILSLFSTPLLAQQFEAYPVPFEYPGLSVACKAALNTIVQCHPILLDVAWTLPRLNSADLTAVCTSACLTSLQSAKTKVTTSCTARDIMVVDNNKYPATYLADYLIYAHTLMCRRDTTTQKYCDVLVMESLNNGDSLSACSDCILGANRVRLNSPFGYDKNAAVKFASLTSSCSRTGYAVTSPSPYTVGSITTSASASAPTYASSCVRTYVTLAGDTCNSIAAARNVSSFAVSGPNGIRDCSNLPLAKKICLLGQCKQYQIKSDDTCQGILTTNKISVDAEVFLAWNPDINSGCTNLPALVGNYICLSLSQGLLIPTLSENYLSNTVSEWPGVAGTVVPAPQLPTAPGTRLDCIDFQNYVSPPPVQDQYYVSSAPRIPIYVNYCDYVAYNNVINLARFLSWNPSLVPGKGCALKPGFSYCVGVPAANTTSVSTSNSVPSSTSSTMSGSSSGLSSTSSPSSSAGVSSTLSSSILISTTRQSSTLITTSVPLSITSTKTSSSTTSSPSPAQVCVEGTGAGNYEGLCSFTCHYGYCPPGPCTCVLFGIQVSVPPATFPLGYPAPGVGASYTGLCEFCCLRGYCPLGACTYTKP